MAQALNYFTATTYRDYGSAASVSTSAATSQTSLCSPEFVRITEFITYSINTTKSSSKQFKKQLALIGTSKDSSKLREKVHNISIKTRIVAEVTVHDLHRLSRLMQRDDHQRKNQLEKLRHRFRTEIETFVALQKEITITMRQRYQEAPFKERVLLLERERQVLNIEKDILEMNHVMDILKDIEDEQLVINTFDMEEGNGNNGDTARLVHNTNRSSHRSRKILNLLVIALLVSLLVIGILLVCKLIRS